MTEAISLKFISLKDLSDMADYLSLSVQKYIPFQ